MERCYISRDPASIESFQGSCVRYVVNGSLKVVVDLFEATHVFACNGQGGDFTRGNGTGGESIYGEKVRRSQSFESGFFVHDAHLDAFAVCR